MRLTKCPPELDLERYHYNDLPLWESWRIKIHVNKCPGCRERLFRFQAFDRALSSIVPEEPPEEFSRRLVQLVESWEPLNPRLEGDRKVSARKLSGFSFKVKWAFSAVMIALGAVFQWRFADYLPVVSQQYHLLGWRDLKVMWDLVSSGVLSESLRLFYMALRIDGFTSLEILGSTLPAQLLSVIVFGGIVTVVFVMQIGLSRSGGYKR